MPCRKKIYPSQAIRWDGTFSIHALMYSQGQIKDFSVGMEGGGGGDWVVHSESIGHAKRMIIIHNNCNKFQNLQLI